MAALFESGRIVDLILVIMVIEAAVLCGLVMFGHDRLGIAERLPGLLLNLAAGACLLLAFRAVVTGAGWTVAGVWLAGALAAHIGDLIQRFRRRP